MEQGVSEQTISVKGLSAGCYFLQFRADKGFTRKLKMTVLE